MEVAAAGLQGVSGGRGADEHGGVEAGREDVGGAGRGLQAEGALVEGGAAAHRGALDRAETIKEFRDIQLEQEF